MFYVTLAVAMRRHRNLPGRLEDLTGVRTGHNVHFRLCGECGYRIVDFVG